MDAANCAGMSILIVPDRFAAPCIGYVETAAGDMGSYPQVQKGGYIKNSRCAFPNGEGKRNGCQT